MTLNTVRILSFTMVASILLVAVGVEVLRNIGMVFQRLNPFPKRIDENMDWCARINGFKSNTDELERMLYAGLHYL